MIFDEAYIRNFCITNHIHDISNSHCELEPLYQFEYNMPHEINKKGTLFSVGIGLNNSPHLLTIVQLINLIKLQKLGFQTQAVLGDLDVILARKDIDSHDKLIIKYKNFLIKLGYNLAQGIIRTQYEETTVARNLLLISPYVLEADFDYVKEDLIDYYAKSAENVLDFPTKISYLLMVSDFISPIMTQNYDRTVVCCGIDESKYAILANKVLRRMELDGNISGLFTGITQGLNGHPKMSKSIPESCIFLTDERDKIFKSIIDGKKHDQNSMQCKLAIAFLAGQGEESKNSILSRYCNGIDVTELEKILVDYIIYLCEEWQKGV